LITAAVLLAVLLSLLFFFPPLWFAVFAALFLLVGAWEWAGLMAWRGGARVAYVVAVLASLLALGWLVMQRPALLPAVLICAVTGWLFILAVLPRASGEAPPHAFLSWRGAVWGVFVLVPPWLALVHLLAADQYGARYVVFLMLLVAVADSAAYFTGRALGRRKLAPRISPGKTWEGAIGAFVAATIFGAGGGLFFGWHGAMLAGFVVLCAVTMALSIVGDLFESLMKRHAGVKDSGTLLPGHGGVLDRVDSITSAAPVFVLGLLLLGAP
jgi:phosphatidate cytidylyltransferase